MLYIVLKDVTNKTMVPTMVMLSDVIGKSKYQIAIKRVLEFIFKNYASITLEYLLFIFS